MFIAPTMVGGCTQSIAGHPLAADTATVSMADVPLAALLIAPDRFPARYPASVLEPAAVDQAVHDVDGAPPDSVVQPPVCAPPAPGPAPRYAVAAAGTDAETDSTIVVTVTRVADPLRVRRAQLADCPSFTTETAGVRSAVTVTLLAPPPVDADDSYAVTQTTASSAGWVRSGLTLVAQLADVRVSATWMARHDTGPEVSPDTEVLDRVFTDAVVHARRAG